MQNPKMANTYLIVDFKEKDAAKALGARWDGSERKWYVPEGRELGPFAQWLPDAVASSSSAAARQLTLVQSGDTGSTGLAMPAKKGVSLSSLLAGVSQAVYQAYKTGVWVLVEVVELRSNGGHVFMGVSERDAAGAVLAKTSAVIWQSMANTILPEFERATGAQLAPGIKLLVRARPVFKPLHGFTMEVDAIDPEYTLGDLEARKREIRERLQAEGVFAANKALPAPWDFNAVLVVAPEGGAGLGDFQAEANRLQKWGVCRFTYTFSRFQGEGAAKEICDALQLALQTWDTSNDDLPDAVVIIRGGGAVNDMAWLNDYDLARFICDLSIPVLTGIGHERDNTVLDEVANIRFDTPSKVILGIEQVVVKRAAQAKADFLQVADISARVVQSMKSKADALDVTVRSQALRHVVQGQQLVAEFMTHIRVDAMQALRLASENSRETLNVVKTEAMMQLADAKVGVPSLWRQITLGANHAIRTASSGGDALIGDVLERARREAAQAKQDTREVLGTVSTLSRVVVREGASRAESLMREIAGQGPEKTLSRGFAMVRDPVGAPITRAAQATDGTKIEIQFQDGRVTAATERHL